jgi:hypothetical protein
MSWIHGYDDMVTYLCSEGFLTFLSIQFCESFCFLNFSFFLLQVAVIAGNLDLAEVIENHKAGDSGIITTG